MNALYCFDRDYWRMACVSIWSLLEKKRADIYVLMPAAAGNWCAKRKIKKICARFGTRLFFRAVRKNENPFQKFAFGKWSPVIFYRLLAHKFFPHVEKFLYLDSDTCVMRDLSPLWNTDLQGNAIAGVRDMGRTEDPKDINGNHANMMKAKYLSDGLYFNSGVLLMDMKQISGAESAMLACDIPLYFPDQDLASYVFDGRKLLLPLEYNFCPECEVYSSKFSPDELCAAKENPAICHFYCLKQYVLLDTNPHYKNFARICSELGYSRQTFLDYYTRKRHRRVLGIRGLSVIGTRARLFGIRVF